MPTLGDVFGHMYETANTPPLQQAAQPAIASLQDLLQQHPQLANMADVWQTVAQFTPGMLLMLGSMMPAPTMLPPGEDKAAALRHFLKMWEPKEEALTNMRVPMRPPGKGHLPAGFDVKKLFRH